MTIWTRITQPAAARVTIHHEGAGKPRDVDLSRFGYSASVFPGGSRIWRPSWTSFATKGYNGRSFDVVFTGDRDEYPLTDEDILRCADLCHTALKRGSVVFQPTTHPHGTLGPRPAGTPEGSSPTQCPGRHVLDRFDLLRWDIAVAQHQ